MAHLQVFMPLPRLHVTKQLELPHLTVLPPESNSGKAESSLTKSRKQLLTALNAASEVACVICQDETIVFRDGAEHNNLAEALVGVSGVTENDFRQHSLLAIPFECSSFRLQKPTRKNDFEVVTAALEQADAALDGIRFNYCRLDVPQNAIGPPGYVADKRIFSVYFHDMDQNQGRIVVHQPANPLSIPGLGLHLDKLELSPVDPLICNTFAPGTLGVRLQRLLRMYSQSFTAASDELKILGNVFALDGCLTPESANSCSFKKFVAMAASEGCNRYRPEFDEFCRFYRDVRNPLVHHGRTYAQLGRNRRHDLFYLQQLLHRILENLTAFASEDFQTYWEKTISLADQQG